MSWAKLDDGFHSHPAIVGLPLDAVGLFALGLSYCGDYLTDGFLPDAWVRQRADGTSADAPLIAGDLWAPVEGGYQVRDYLDYNPSREQVLADRERISRARSKAGKKGARARWQSR